VDVEPLRIVSLNAYQAGFQLVHEFAERNGHEIVLVVTLPHSTRYGESVRPMVLDLPERSNALITSKLRTVAAPVIETLRPDVIISAAFPRLIPRRFSSSRSTARSTATRPRCRPDAGRRLSG
jgi:methionyl-tRNA formyltransferase